MVVVPGSVSAVTRRAVGGIRKPQVRCWICGPGTGRVPRERFVRYETSTASSTRRGRRRIAM